MSVFPEEFQFYHLGTVRPAPLSSAAVEALLEESEGFVFRLEGAARGLVAVLTEQGLSPDIYAELANVLASRVADGLSKESGGLPVWPSPPRPVTGRKVKDWATASGASPRRASYLHVGAALSVPIDVWVIGGVEEAHGA